jgi:hypothetical protein
MQVRLVCSKLGLVDSMLGLDSNLLVHKTLVLRRCLVVCMAAVYNNLELH